METVKEKVAYLQGLSKGLNISDRSPEGKLLLNVIDAFENIADELEKIQCVQEDLEEYVETMDEDLADLEDTFYDDSDNAEDDSVEVQCPECHETVSFDADVLGCEDHVEVSCPQCGEVVYHNYNDNDPGL